MRRFPVEQRVADLLARMTLEEKVAQMISTWTAKAEIQDSANYLRSGQGEPARYPDGIGFFTRPSDQTGPGSPRVTPPRSIEESVRYVNALQKWAREDTRLGIPVLLHEESLHGLAAQMPPAFRRRSASPPPGIRTSSARSTILIAAEVRARGVHQVLSPVVDVARDPRWGRIEETFGEDPFLVGEMGVAAVEGLQGVGKDRSWRTGPGAGDAQAHDRPRPARKRHQYRPRPDLRAQRCARCSSRRSSRWWTAPPSTR